MRIRLDSSTHLTWLLAVSLIGLAIIIGIGRKCLFPNDLPIPAAWERYHLTWTISGSLSPGHPWILTLPSEQSNLHMHEQSCSLPEGIQIARHNRDLERTTYTFFSTSSPRNLPSEYSTIELSMLTACSRTPDPLDPPSAGAYREAEFGIPTNDAATVAMVRTLTGTCQSPAECLECLFQYSDRKVSGTSLERSRELTALCRQAGFPARVVQGIDRVSSRTTPVLTWVEAWLDDRWVSMCPVTHRFDHLPPQRLALIRGGPMLIQAIGLPEEQAPIVQVRVDPFDMRTTDTPSNGMTDTFRQAYVVTSPMRLPMADRATAEWLLMLPIAALIVACARNLIGLITFGTFTPALLGLSLREAHSARMLAILIGILGIGWIARKALQHLHLLQVPRAAILLTLVVMGLLAVMLIGPSIGIGIGSGISLFPLVILTGMIERFWTLEEEDSPRVSIQTLGTTLAIAGLIAFVLSWSWLRTTLMHAPEILLGVVACLLILGRYTGYRLIELFRFREIASPSDSDPAVVILSERQSIHNRMF